MKGTFSTSLRRPLAAAALMVSILAMSSGTVGATSLTTTTLATATTKCDVVASPAVRFVSKSSPCVIQVRAGTYVHVKFGTGMRWSYPVSNSHAVAVVVISRTSLGVTAITLHAAAIGRARIQATGTFRCPPGAMCPDLVMLWSLQVIVT